MLIEIRFSYRLHTPSYRGRRDRAPSHRQIVGMAELLSAFERR